MQRGWVGEVEGLFFFSLQKLFPMRADEVGTNHPIFSFFDSPCLRHRVLHNGSFCQFIGKPMAVTSTEGYVARRLFNLVLNASPLPIESSQYATQQVMAYSLLPSMPVAFIQAPLMVAPIWGALARRRFHIREWWAQQLRRTVRLRIQLYKTSCWGRLNWRAIRFLVLMSLQL